MSIPLRARGIDLLNLVVGKASNFMLIAILFAIVSRGMDATAFSAFGYWWSIGIMVGGVFLGGMGSAAVRTVAVSASLRSALRVGYWLIAATPLVGLLIATAAAGLGRIATEQVLLGVVVGAFGISVMLQTIVFGLLRALEDSRGNTIASAVVVLLVPASFWLMAGPHPGLTRLFFALASAFGLGTAACIAIGWTTLRALARSGASVSCDSRRFVRDAMAFTAVNVFSYAAVNFDFTLIKWLGTTEEFALLASGKVYFERFVLPALMVFAGAISLRVLRHANYWPGGAARIEARLGGSFAASALLAVAAMAAGYWVFSALIRHDPRQLAWASAIAASAGYLLFAFNAVLLDVLVVRVRIRAVVAHVVAFVVLGGAIQWLAFLTLRVPGWALGWLVFNAAVTAALATECLRIRLGRDEPPPLH